LKRIFDILFSLVCLILFSPVFIFIVLAIKLFDRGPVFYKAPRVGKHGIPFRMFKFRTMVVNADRIGGSSTADDDPRITQVGKWLRKYKLDEFPQLLNVLLGDMSIVGPRPEVKEYVDMFNREEKIILSVRPGMTDWASVWNPDEGKLLQGSSDPDKTYLEHIRPGKIRLQMKYVQEKSFRTDLKIIWTTLKILFKR
jgi:lipopolysaccharide/colanic/teichoic acid biosynthesis glycosyltransferase